MPEKPLSSAAEAAPGFAREPILQLPHATVTPPIAGASLRAVMFAAERAAEEVRRNIAGEPPHNPCW